MAQTRLPAISFAAQSPPGGIFGELQHLGRVAGSIAALGAVAGFAAAIFWKAKFPLSPLAEAGFGEWTGFSAGLAGLFALVVEIVVQIVRAG